MKGKVHIMFDKIQDILLTLILAIVCGTFAWLAKTNKQRILTQVTDLVQKAEKAVQGTNMGTEKKALVVAQLEAAGVSVNSWLSSQIDTIVSTLNSKGAWLAEQTQETISGLASGSTTESGADNANA